MQPTYQFGPAPFIVEIDEAAHLLPLLQVFGSIYFSCVERLTLSTVLQKIHGWSDFWLAKKARKDPSQDYSTTAKKRSARTKRRPPDQEIKKIT